MSLAVAALLVAACSDHPSGTPASRATDASLPATTVTATTATATTGTSTTTITTTITTTASTSASASVRLPPVGARFDYQLGGDSPLPAGVTVVARDWQDGTPPGGGVYTICYVNAFQSQAGVDWPAGVVTRFEDPDWPGEFVIDLSTAAKRATAAAVVQRMIDTCRRKGFDAVEFDNLDSYTRVAGLPFGVRQTMEYAKVLVAEAHAAGLAAGQKNTPELAGAGIGFDFAIAEQCGEYRECDRYTAAYGPHLLAIEYTDAGLAAACAALGPHASVIERDLDLAPAGQSGHRYATCRSALAATTTSGG